MRGHSSSRPGRHSALQRQTLEGARMTTSSQSRSTQGLDARERRRQERLDMAERLRSRFRDKKSPRLSKDDQPIVVRNLGKMIEKRWPNNKNCYVKQIFEQAFGIDGALS